MLRLTNLLLKSAVEEAARELLFNYLIVVQLELVVSC